MRLPETKNLTLPVAAFAAFGAALMSHLAHFGFSATTALTLAAVLLNGLVALGDKVAPGGDGTPDEETQPHAGAAQRWTIRASSAALLVICLASIASVVSPSL